MKTLATAVALLTRIPAPGSTDPAVAGRSTRWFPVVGALIGGAYAAIACLVSPRLPSAVTAVLIVIAEALLTGALHMDGLADTADGFGGGKNAEDALRIMRDHAIGSYGAVALTLLVAFKVTAMAALIDRHTAVVYLLLSAVLGRWSVAPLSRFLPYARPGGGISSFVKTPELIWSSLFTAAVVLPWGLMRGLVCWLLVAAATAAWGWVCRRKIGGVTGDTLGAAVELCECVALLAGLLI